MTEEEVKSEIDTAYQAARSLPASKACANRNAVQSLIDLEEKRGASYCTDLSKGKIKSLGLFAKSSR
jgi:hypothetical protein